MAVTKRKRGAQRGNLNAAKHLLYSPRFKSLGVLSVKDLELADPDVDHEIALLRQILRRVVALADKKDAAAAELAGLLELAGTTALRIGSLKRTKKLLGGEGDGGLESALEQALEAVALEKGLTK